ncbi:hypothetical protein JCM19232_2935 [Vibrio ishigakensis]|uniref:BIG2 domain-containing protein n=1 Tax=Vibrio ishigakensis TaxID=1481914 RepID=A0A0B8PGH9_9VIBR|nr:hypothetical protein JCM19232_2935 [Vibrio ishigakensis]
MAYCESLGEGWGLTNIRAGANNSLGIEELFNRYGSLYDYEPLKWAAWNSMTNGIYNGGAMYKNLHTGTAGQDQTFAERYLVTCKIEQPREAVSITLSPDNATINVGKTQQYTVTADIPGVGAVDVTQMADIYDPANGETYVSVDNNGLATGTAMVQSTTLQADYGSQSDTVNVTIAPVCNTLADACIDARDRGDGIKFTSSPSRAFLELRGLAHLATSWVTENGTAGPAGEFGKFTFGDAAKLCAQYNNLRIGGRTNWELPALDVIEWSLWKWYGERSMFELFGWPTYISYWTTTNADVVSNYAFDLDTGSYHSWNQGEPMYVTCVSYP